MRILFVSPSLGWTDSAAIASLSAIAKASGHQTYYTHLDKQNEDWMTAVQEIDPRIIAYSSDTGGWPCCVERNQQAQQKFDFVSIAGGSHPTQCPESFDASGMDAFCVGEGEGAWEDFLRAVDGGTPFSRIPNIIAWEGNEKKMNPVRPYIANLNTLPMPDRDLVLGTTRLHATEKKTFFTSRGCPFRCAYCQNDTWKAIYSGKGKPVRRFSPERVIREMEMVKAAHNMTFVKIDDDCFATRVDEWLQELCDHYRARIGLPFNCLLRLDHIDDMLLSMLNKAGCYSVHLSVDSTNPSIRERMLNRRYTNDDILRKLHQIHRYGIRTWVNFMLTLPGSTVQDDLDTIAFARRGRVTYSSYTTTVPTPGTALYQTCKAQGLLPTGKENMSGELFYRPSLLKGFSESRKRTSYNVFLLGPHLAKLPVGLSRLGTILLRYLPNLRIFRKIRDWGYEQAVTNTIYKLK